MKKSIVIMLGWAVLLTAGRMLQPSVAAAGDDCSGTCAATLNSCMEKAKDSPNDIDRELCQKDNADCRKQCDEQYKQQMEEKEKDRVQKEQEQKATWDYQGLTPEQQQAEKIKQQQEEEEQKYHTAPQEQ